ncbi:MAG: hypothetical protein PHU85_09180 [Phycisphaerae bacterium]|nr:hypothetical protein [Phycisphaerae bacterium]
MRRICGILFVLHLASGVLLAQKSAAPASQPDAEKVVVGVAPFVSTTDGGRWGKAVTDAFQLKLVRWPLTSPIDKFSFADIAESEKIDIRWDTPAATLAKFARDALGAKILIYGDVTPNAKGDAATLRVRAIDLRAGPTLAVDRTFELSYPTQLRPAVEMVLNQLVGYSTVNMEVPALVKLTPAMERRWTEGGNLVPNPDFEQGDPAGKLTGWEVVIGDKRYNPAKFEGASAPIVDDFLKHGWWSLDPADAKNRVLHFAISENVAATYGVACYSDWIPITPGCIYRFSYRWRVDGPTPKVFLKGYALCPTPGEKEAGKDQPMAWQRREVYRRQVHPTSEADPKRDLGNGWTETTADLCPRHDQRPPHWLRVDIYGYWPKGRAWFDHVVLKQLSDKPVVEQKEPNDLPKMPTTSEEREMQNAK